MNYVETTNHQMQPAVDLFNHIVDRCLSGIEKGLDSNRHDFDRDRLRLLLGCKEMQAVRYCEIASSLVSGEISALRVCGIQVVVVMQESYMEFVEVTG